MANLELRYVIVSKKKGAKGRAAKGAKPPKVTCCESKTKCSRCPLRMLKEGTLPPPYTVKKRVLVTVDKTGEVKPVKKSKLKKDWAA